MKLKVEDSEIRLDEICSYCEGTGEITNHRGSGMKLCPNCEEGRVLTEEGEQLAKFIHRYIT